MFMNETESLPACICAFTREVSHDFLQILAFCGDLF